MSPPVASPWPPSSPPTAPLPSSSAFCRTRRRHSRPPRWSEPPPGRADASVIPRDDFPARAGGKGHERLVTHGRAEELHVAVGEHEVHPANVVAVEAVRLVAAAGPV